MPRGGDKPYLPLLGILTEVAPVWKGLTEPFLSVFGSLTNGELPASAQRPI
jgi:hypothetical protein